MGLGPIHCGSFLLLVAFVLLLVATISAPVIHEISFLNVYDGGSKTTFGVFGYCLNANVSGQTAFQPSPLLAFRSPYQTPLQCHQTLKIQSVPPCICRTRNVSLTSSRSPATVDAPALKSAMTLPTSPADDSTTNGPTPPSST